MERENLFIKNVKNHHRNFVVINALFYMTYDKCKALYIFSILLIILSQMGSQIFINIVTFFKIRSNSNFEN